MNVRSRRSSTIAWGKRTRVEFLSGVCAMPLWKAITRSRCTVVDPYLLFYLRWSVVLEREADALV